MNDSRPSQAFLDFHQHLLEKMSRGFVPPSLFNALKWWTPPKMSDEPLVHFDVAKIIIDPVIREGKSMETPTISYPYHRVRVITVNGEIWDKLFDPWGLSEATVRANWDTRNLETWTQYKPQ